MYLLRKVVDETLANSTNRSNEQGGKEGTRREREDSSAQAKRTQVQAKRTLACPTKLATFRRGWMGWATFRRGGCSMSPSISNINY
jgi:hypothetical protein